MRKLRFGNPPTPEATARQAGPNGIKGAGRKSRRDGQYSQEETEAGGRARRHSSARTRTWPSWNSFTSGWPALMCFARGTGWPAASRTMA